MTKLRLSERQPIVRSKLLKDDSSYKGIGEMYVVEQEVNYKNHHHFVAIDPLVEEKELPKDEEKKDPIGLS